MSDRIKRIIAFIIDWNVTLFPFVLVFAFLAMFMKAQSSFNLIIFIVCFLRIISAFVVFVLRDVIFKGRSLGKRIFGLHIFDKNNMGETSVKQRIIRNIFFFLYTIDGIILLITGETIGDRLANTKVFSKKSIENDTAEENPVPVQFVPKKTKRKVIALVIIIPIILIIGFSSLLIVILNSRKDTEEYKLAYNYLITSEAFQRLNADESKIFMNRYSFHTYSSVNSDSVSQTVEVGFIVNFRSFEVVCHKEDGEWQVCDECTLFD